MIQQFKIPLALTIIALTFISAGIYFTLSKNSKNSVTFIENNVSVSSSSAQIVIHIAGEVENPGLYNVAKGTRLGQALEIAGGLTNNADVQMVEKSLNFAAVLTDGAKIYIPKKGENVLPAQTTVLNTTLLEGVSINNATKAELMELVGIGEVRAQSIIDNRPYQSLNELVEKKIIPASVYEKIKDKITL